MEQLMYARGDIYYIDLNPTQGSEINKIRPCIIVSANPINKARRTVVVVPLSSSAKPHPPIVIAMQSAGLISSVAICDQVRAVDKARIGKKIGVLKMADLELLDDSLRQVLVL